MEPSNNCEYINSCNYNSSDILSFKFDINTIKFSLYCHYPIILTLSKEFVLHDENIVVTLNYDLNELIRMHRSNFSCKVSIGDSTYTFYPTYIDEYIVPPYEYLKHIRIINEIFNLRMDWLNTATNDEVILHSWDHEGHRDSGGDEYNGPTQPLLRINEMTQFAIKLYSSSELYFKNMFPITFEKFMESCLCTSCGHAESELIWYIKDTICAVQKIPEFSTFISDFFKKVDQPHQQLQFIDIPVDIVY